MTTPQRPAGAGAGVPGWRRGPEAVLAALTSWRPETEDERRLLVQVGWGRVGLTLVGLLVAAVTPGIDPDRGRIAVLFVVVWLPMALLQLLLAKRGHGAPRRLASIVLDAAAIAVFLFAVPQPGSGAVLGFMVFVGLHALLDSYAGGLLVTLLGTGALLVATGMDTPSATVLGNREVAVFAAAAGALTALTGYAAQILARSAHGVQTSYHMAKDQLALSLEAAEMGLWEWDVAADHIEWSSDTLRIFGRHAAPPDVASFVELVHPDDRAMLERRLQAALVAGGAYQVHHRIVVDGRTKWLFGKGRVFQDAAGTPVRLIGAVTDVTEQREQQQQLERSRRMETVTGLAGGFAHDFNNVLAVIMMTAEVLRRSPLEAAQRERVEFLLEAARRGAAVSNKLLVFAQRESGHPVPVRLDALVDDVRPMLERALRADIALTVDVPTSLPSAVADPALLEQALLNLAVNARDAIPAAGEVRVAARAAADGSGSVVLLEVTDTGVGMTDEVRDSALEPFFTTKGPDRGTGLGLASVYSTVTAIGGRVEIDSRVGHGTTVRLVLPVTAEVPRDEAPEDAGPVPGPSSRVLVVAHDAGIARMLSELLTRLGHEVVDAVDGPDALRLMTERPELAPDLVIADVVMPDVSGPELVAELARRGVTCGVVYMTGYLDREPDPLGPGGAPVLRKPFTARELSEALAQVREGVPAAGAAQSR